MCIYISYSYCLIYLFYLHVFVLKTILPVSITTMLLFLICLIVLTLWVVAQVFFKRPGPNEKPSPLGFLRWNRNRAMVWLCRFLHLFFCAIMMFIFIIFIYNETAYIYIY